MTQNDTPNSSPAAVTNSASSAPTKPVPIVASASPPVVMADENIAVTPVAPPLTNSENGVTVTVTVTPTNTKRHPIQKQCEYCGAVFAAKRPRQAKYCSAVCRRKAWLVANPDKAAVLAERDKARLRAHIESRGGTWEVRSNAC